MKKIAVDLLWVRPGKVGGTEVYIRNLLDGFRELKDDFRLVLLVSKDNAGTFQHYAQDTRFQLLKANVLSSNIAGRILWQYFCQNRFLKKNGLRDCFVPVYCRPFFNGGIKYINTVHDIQAYHFPQYHPFHELLYSYVTWFAAAHFSERIIAISKFVKDDICENFGFKRSKVTVIPDPVVVDTKNVMAFPKLREKYHIEENGYYYTVSQNIPHKNFVTLVKVIYKIKKQNEKTGEKLPDKLLVSGIKGNASADVAKLIEELGVQDNIIQTGYISDAERNCLIKNARAFLFPSYFEGFGIPPVEALMLGQRVITTNQTSIPEVTCGLADYVEDYLNPDAWIEVMKRAEDPVKMQKVKVAFSSYDRHIIARHIMALLQCDRLEEKRVTKEENAIYEKLYDIVAYNKRKSDVSLDFSKEEFLSDIGEPPQELMGVKGNLIYIIIRICKNRQVQMILQKTPKPILVIGRKMVG